MNGKSLLVDTNILIYLIDGDETVRDILEGKSIHLSFITKIELSSFKPLKKEEKSLITDLLKNTKTIFADDSISEMAISLRNKYKLRIPDALIAGTSYLHNLPLFYRR